MIRALGYSIKEAFKQVHRNKMMSFVSVLSIFAMLLILGLFFFLTVNVNYATESIKQEFDTIEVFLEDETSQPQAMRIAENLGTMKEIEKVEYISKEQAAEDFRRQLGEYAYLLDGLANNPLPNSLRLSLTDLEYGTLVAEICRTMVGVEDVRYYQTEVQKVLDIADVIQKGALVIILFLIIISVVVVSNTVKLTVMARQDEIAIMKYVGATNWFVRGPFIIEGMIMGLLSALLALGLSAFLYIKIEEQFNDEVVMLFSSSLVDAGFMISNLCWVFIALGVSIGAIGSIFSMRRFLKA